MADGVDAGIYRTMSRAASRVYLWTMLALMLAGLFGAIGLIGWFAFGEPSRPLGRRRRAPSVT